MKNLFKYTLKNVREKFSPLQAFIYKAHKASKKVVIKTGHF